MANISNLSRLINGVQRNVDLSANTLVVDMVKVGGGSGTDLSKTILDRLISLQDGSDVSSAYHTHDGRYFTETELGSSSASSGSDLIGDDNTYSNFTPAAATIKGALSGIDSALVSAGAGKVKVSSADTDSDYLTNSITAGAGLSKTITDPAGDEILDFAVNVDNSTIEINSDSLRVKDAGITNAKVATGIDAAKLADGSVSNAEFQYLDGVTSSIQTQLNAKVAKAGSSMDSAANITFSGGGEVLGLPATPSAAGAAASKAYVDAVALGLAPKKAVRVATTVPGTLATSFEDGDVIDGITLATGDRILIKDQATASQNGIYTVNATGAPTRAIDFDSVSPIDEINGAWVPVQFGSQAGRVFVQYGSVSTVGTDAITFEFYNPIAALIGGDMVSVAGSTITLDLASTSGLESTNAGDPAGQLRIKLEASDPTLKISGSNELGVKLSAAGAISTSVSGIQLNVDSTTVEINSNTLRVKDLGITSAKLGSNSVTTLKISDSNVTLAKLASDSVDENKIVSTSMSSSGAITGGSGTKLAVAVDDSTIEINTNALRIKNAGVTLAKLASDSVDENKIVSTTLAASLTGGSGAKLAVASSPRGLKSVVAGESFAADTSFLVRWAVSGETAGRVYKADKDATSADKFMVFGIVLKGTAATAGDPIDVCFEGTHTLGTNDSPFSSGDVGKAVYLTAAGGFSTTAPTTTNEAVWRIGVVESTTKIWVGDKQLNGIN